ncbi:MAG TPA: Pycsar system effector family protein [Myxococcales bacterium]|nr:Pycsar system effector family protein [Myxococcales bacterium]
MEQLTRNPLEIARFLPAGVAPADTRLPATATAIALKKRTRSKGKHDKRIVKLAAEHVFDLFRQANADQTLVFHGFKRSRDAAAAAKEIAKGSKLEGADVTTVMLAAWFHDAGHAVAKDGKRGDAVELARAFLAEQGASRELADSVASAIESAWDPAQEDPLHEVLHDALLAPLSDKDFLEQAHLFRLERERRTGKRLSDVEWTKRCIAYVEAHGYRTRYAQLEYDRGREANLMRLHKLLRKQEAETAEQKADEAKVAKGAGKTVENVFYFLTKMTVQVMQLADRRTSTMIHVNAIMISAVVALLLRKIETQRYLLAPTLVLLAVNLVVIVVAVYSMRLQPRRPEPFGAGQGQSVFAFDSSVSLQQYQESMSELALDGPRLQKAMVDQLYVSRIVLNERARALRLTYDVFIYGLALALAVFAFVLIRR